MLVVLYELGGITEAVKEYIASVVERLGLTEHEAHIMYHLDRAIELYWELYDQDPNDPTLRTDGFTYHQQAQVRLLAWRVVKRDHPNGWLTGQKKD